MWSHMPQGEEGTVYWSNDDDKTTEQQSATRPLSSLWKWSPAAGQMEWNLFFWIYLARHFLLCLPPVWVWLSLCE